MPDRKFHILFLASLLALLCTACAAAPAEPDVPEPVQTETQEPPEEESENLPEESQEEPPSAEEADWSLVPTAPEGAAPVPWEIRSEPADGQEYLIITSSAGRGRLIVSCLDIATGELEQLMNIATQWACYPVSAVDFENQKIYYSSAGYNGESYDLFDNLFVYDMTDGTSTQLTYGKNEFNDLLIVNGKLYANVARQYANAVQPAVFDYETNTFTYLDPDDDDTLFCSFSPSGEQEHFVTLTCLFSETRTHRVCAETYIEPRTISFLDYDLTHREPVYSTEDFQIYMTRQVDDDHILMTAEDNMLSGNIRNLRLLTISTGEVVPFPIPGMFSVRDFYPRAGGKGVYVVGRAGKWDDTRSYALYYYDAATQTTSRVSPKEALGSIVNIVYCVCP